MLSPVSTTRKFCTDLSPRAVALIGNGEPGIGASEPSPLTLKPFSNGESGEAVKRNWLSLRGTSADIGVGVGNGVDTGVGVGVGVKGKPGVGVGVGVKGEPGVGVGDTVGVGVGEALFTILRGEIWHPITSASTRRPNPIIQRTVAGLTWRARTFELMPRCRSLLAH